MNDKSKEATIVELVRWMKEQGVANNQTLLEVLHERATNHYVEVLIDYAQRRVVGSRGPVKAVLGIEPEDVEGRDPLELVGPDEQAAVESILEGRPERSGPNLRQVRRMDTGDLFEAVTSGQREQGSIWAVRVVPVAV